eukprot:g1276.t1
MDGVNTQANDVSLVSSRDRKSSLKSMIQEKTPAMVAADLVEPLSISSTATTRMCTIEYSETSSPRNQSNNAGGNVCSKDKGIHTWVTPKEAFSRVRKAYVANGLTLTQRLRLEHLISRGMEKLVTEALDVHSKNQEAKLKMRAQKGKRDAMSNRRNNTSDPKVLYRILREKLRKGDLTPAEYRKLVRQIESTAKIDAEIEESEEVKEMRARMSELENMERGVLRSLGDLAAMRAKEDVRKVTWRVERTQRERTARAAAEAGDDGSSTGIEEKDMKKSINLWLSADCRRRRSLSDSECMARFMKQPSGERELLMKYEDTRAEIARLSEHLELPLC